MIFSDKLEAFIRHRIDSVTQLEALLLVYRKRPQAFSAQEVAKELRAPEDAVRRYLDALVAGGLLGLIFEASARYVFRPTSPTLEERVAELATQYGTFRIRIIELIFTKPKNPLESFADAFRFKKGDDDV